MKRKRSIKAALLAAMFAAPAVMASNTASAQTVVPASNTDNMINNYGYPNVATIDYSPFPGSSPITQLTAVAADPGAPGGSALALTVMDGVTPFAMGFPWVANISPDVVLGNDLATSGNYIAGVVITAPAPVGPGNDAYLYIYNISGVGLGMSISMPTIINISNSGNVVGAAHIDAIAEYSNLYPSGGSGLPLVDKYAITWYDSHSGIMGYFGSLNGLFTGVQTVINSNTNLSSPDVAAVERSGGGFEDWALFTYIDPTVSPNKLYYQEWRMSPYLPPSSPILYDNAATYDVTYTPGVSAVRIDAIDDYSQNTGGGGNATFNIVASASLAPGVNAVYEYNDITGPLAPTDITSPVAGLATNANILPVVTCGPGAFYTVGYYSNSGTPPNQGYYATAIDWSTGLPTTDPNAYQIPLTWASSAMPGWINGVGLAATCNTNGTSGQQLEAAFESGGNLYEKSTITAAPYGFKHSASVTPTVVSATEWLVSPNPAADHIVLSAPRGIAIGNNTTFDIRDLSGKLILKGRIDNTVQQIDVNKLAAGMYLIKIHSQQADTKTIKFVKQ